jgi:zinc D-Ala-D-Ala carboxypeptidase
MPSEQLSEHFTLAEMTYSQTASRAGLKNIPTPEAHVHLQQLAATMEQVRSICCACPVTITSGYRSPEVNALVGGSTTSAHMSGLACDFIIPQYGTPLDVCHALELYLDVLGIDQLIHEYDDWVHLAIAVKIEDARCECLTISNAGTTTGFA